MEVDNKFTPVETFDVVDCIKKEIKQEYDSDVNSSNIAEGNLVKNQPFFVDVQLKVESDLGEEEAKYFITDDDLKELSMLERGRILENPNDEVTTETVHDNTCPYCDKRFLSVKYLKQHIIGHTQERRFHCALCNRAFRGKHNLVVHIKSHRDERNIPCPLCHKRFIVKSALKSHLRIHSNERPYSCHICGKTFAYGANLKTHIATHSGGLLFECDECEERFRDRRQRLKHMKLHHIDCTVEGCDFCLKFKMHSERPFKDFQRRSWKCPFCSEEFKYSHTYKNHMKTHNDENLVCKYCNKTYLKRAYLHIHMRNHTGETPYECSVCRKKFKRKDSLKYHLSTHNKKRELCRCDVCDQEFTHSSSLFRHKRTAHSIAINRSTITCQLCEQTLKEKAYRGHMKQHGVFVSKCRKCREYIEGEDESERHRKLCVIDDREEKELKGLGKGVGDTSKDGSIE